MPAVLVQDRFVSTVYWGYTIIVSHVLVTLSVFSWIGDEQNLWFVSVTRRRDARDDTHHSFCVVTLDSAGHWTQPLALVRARVVPNRKDLSRGWNLSRGWKPINCYILCPLTEHCVPTNYGLPKVSKAWKIQDKKVTMATSPYAYYDVHISQIW